MGGARGGKDDENGRRVLAALTGVTCSASRPAPPRRRPPISPAAGPHHCAAGGRAGIDLQARVPAQSCPSCGPAGGGRGSPGRHAIIGSDYVAKAAPDGYTIVYAPVTSVTTNAFIYKNLAYDPQRDFADHPDDGKPDGRGGLSGVRPQVDQGPGGAGEAGAGKINYGSFGIGNLTT